MRLSKYVMECGEIEEKILPEKPTDGRHFMTMIKWAPSSKTDESSANKETSTLMVSFRIEFDCCEFSQVTLSGEIFQNPTTSHKTV